MVATRILPFLILLPTLSLAWVCYPPPHLIPDRVDCVALILGLEHLATQPADEAVKRWGRHLPTTPRTEQLPRWYYLVDERLPPASCAVLVDAMESEPDVVADFRLEDVARAAKTIYSQCLVSRGQVGLEFPTEEYRVVARLQRLDGFPSRLLRIGTGDGTGEEDQDESKGEIRREMLPNGMGVLYISNAEPGRFNLSDTV
ncbi:MAG: hypothetical protein Q9216_002001 [Gyalolechia sp. 2 TL-2023]